MSRPMKDSGVEWIGEIPADWRIVKYKKFAKIGMGSTLLREDVLIKKENGSVPIYSATQEDKIFGYLKNPKVVLNTYDLVIPARGNSIGYVTMIEEDVATCTQTTIYSKIKGINPKFLFYCANGLREHWFYFVQTAIPQITVSQVQNNLVPVPSSDEQQRIANFLDNKTYQIDSILADTKQSIAEFKKYKQAFITETVTKGLNLDVKMKDSGSEWIGEIPEHWDVVKLNQFFKQVKEKNQDLAERNLLSLSYGKIIRKNINTKEGLLPDNFEGYNIIEKDDIVLRMTDLQNDHTSLRVGLSRERGIITSAYITIRQFNEIDAEYGYYFLHSFDIYKGFYGLGSGVRQGVTYDILKKLEILLPPLNEQQQIVAYLDEKSAHIDTLIADKEKLIGELETYKKALIFEYVTGKKEVE